MAVRGPAVLPPSSTASKKKASTGGGGGSAATTKKAASNSGGGGGGGGGGGSNAADKFAKEQSKLQKQQEQSKKAQNQAKYNALRRQVDTLGKQAKLQTKMLKAQQDQFNNDVATITKLRDQQLKTIKDSFAKQANILQGSVADNEKATAAESFSNILNRSRERQNAMDQAALHGAGESDTLRSLNMSLRNWGANQGDINRSFYDTLRETQSAVADLNMETKTGLTNTSVKAASDLAQAQKDFNDARSATLVDQGNILGQMSQAAAEAAVMSNDPNSGIKNLKKNHKVDVAAQNKANKDALKAFDQATKAAGTVVKTQGVPSDIQNWQGMDKPTGQQNVSDSRLGFSTQSAFKTPEGATLRKWR